MYGRSDAGRVFEEDEAGLVAGKIGEGEGLEDGADYRLGWLGHCYGAVFLRKEEGLR